MNETNKEESKPQPKTAIKSDALATPAQAEQPLVKLADAYEMALEPRSLQDAMKVCEMMAEIGYCGIRSPAQALSRMMYGRTLGLTAMASLANIFDIDNKPGTYAEVMLGICLQHPRVCEFFFIEESTTEKAVARAKRHGFPEARPMVWTIDDAIRADLVNRGETPEKQKRNNWNRYPAQMLRARAISAQARLVFPDLVRGFRSVEELRDERRTITVDPEGRILEDENAPSGTASQSVAVAIKNRMVAAVTLEDMKPIVDEIKAFEGDDAELRDLKEAYAARVKELKKVKGET